MAEAIKVLLGSPSVLFLVLGIAPICSAVGIPPRLHLGLVTAAGALEGLGCRVAWVARIINCIAH